MKRTYALTVVLLLMILLAVNVNSSRAGQQADIAGQLEPGRTSQGFIHHLPKPIGQADQESRVFFPIVQWRHILDEVITYSWEDFYYFHANGYVMNLTDTPVYSVTMDVLFNMWSSFVDPPITFTEEIQVTPALTATLPGQINPFYFDILTYKSNIESYSILGITAAPYASGDVYYPLSIVSYSYEGTDLSGIVRNDNSQPLHHLRAVVLDPYGQCGWREATIDSNNLLPAQETTFHLASYCLSSNLIIVGQGAASP